MTTNVLIRMDEVEDLQKGLKILRKHFEQNVLPELKRRAFHKTKGEKKREARRRAIRRLRTVARKKKKRLEAEDQKIPQYW